MTGWVKTRQFVDFRSDMREREYGIVEDEADSVELTASTHEEFDEQTHHKTQRKETIESMI